MTDIQLYQKIAGLPDHLKKEVENFIDSLGEKSNSSGKREYGTYPNFFKLEGNFDEPLDDFKDYM